MGKLDVDRSLEQLQSEAKLLLREGDRDGTRDSGFSDSVAAWYAAVSDVLTLSLPESSRLLESLKQSWDRYTGKGSDNEAGTRRLIVDGHETTDSQGNPSKLVERCLPIISQARRYILSRPLTADEEKDIRREIRAAITETYLSFKSWWFYIPSVILVIAAVFVVTGAINIKNYRLDIGELEKSAKERIDDQVNRALGDGKRRLNSQVDAALDDAQTRINEQKKALAKNDAQIKALSDQVGKAIEDAKNTTTSELNARLGTFISQRETDIGSVTRNKIKQIEDSVIPDGRAQIEDMRTRLAKIAGQLSDLEGRAGTLEGRAKRLESTATEAVPRLYQPETLGVIALVVACIGCVLSLVVGGYLTAGWWGRSVRRCLQLVRIGR
jgi:vacuolar-type H+-ATPase subunit H